MIRNCQLKVALNYHLFLCSATARQRHDGVLWRPLIGRPSQRVRYIGGLRLAGEKGEVYDYSKVDCSALTLYTHTHVQENRS